MVSLMWNPVGLPKEKIQKGFAYLCLLAKGLPAETSMMVLSMKHVLLYSQTIVYAGIKTEIVQKLQDSTRLDWDFLKT